MSVGSVHSQIRPPRQTAQHGTARRSRSTTPTPSSSSSSHAPVPVEAAEARVGAGGVSSTNSSSERASATGGAGSLRRHRSNVLSANPCAARDVSYYLPVRLMIPLASASGGATSEPDGTPYLNNGLLCPLTFYRRHRPAPGHQQPRKTPARALNEHERERVLDGLASPRFVDRSPAEVVATLLDEGQSLCSERTMYRILAAEQPVRERRNPLTHPPCTKPELVATACARASRR